MRPHRFTLLVVCTVLVGSGSLLLDLRFDLQLARERAALTNVEHDIASMTAALGDWRAAEASYVATGQGPALWVQRATDRSSEIEATLVRLQSATTSADARVQYDAATSALGDLNGVDGRAREFATSDRRFEASDLVFGDAVGPTQRLSTAFAAALDAEERSSDARIAGTRWRRLGANALALAALVAAAILWFRRAAAAATAAAEAGEAAATALADGVVTPARAATINLVDAADLCVDLGRVLDGEDVPALFERLAPVLGARGLVLWTADAGGGQLRPSLTLGYSERVIERLGTLPVDSDNVTSLAFRSMRSQAVNGAAPAAPGAIAVPLVTATGCVGVLAAEVSRTRPDHETIAVARMIAAQFAALMASPHASPMNGMPEARTARV